MAATPQHEAGVDERRLHAQPFCLAIQPVGAVEALGYPERSAGLDEHAVVSVRRRHHLGGLAGDRPRVGVAVKPLLESAQAFGDVFDWRPDRFDRRWPESVPDAADGVCDLHVQGNAVGR